MAVLGAATFEVLVYTPGNPLFPTLRDETLEKLPHETGGAFSIVPMAAAARSGRYAKTLGAASPLLFLEWYIEQWWITPRHVAFGNISRNITREIVIFSTHLDPHSLVSIDLSPVQPGVDFETGFLAALPLTIGPYERVTFDVIADEIGLDSFDSFIPFVFDNRSPLVRFSGARVAAWDIEPNWIEALVERQIWKTDVIEAEDGHEQRIALKGAPRLEWEFTFDVTEDLRRRFQLMIPARGGGLWLVPVFTDFAQLTDVLPINSLTIPLDLDHDMMFEAGYNGMLIFEGRSEVVSIAEIGSAELLLDAPTAFEWPIGTKVYPVKLARMDDPRQTAAFFRNYARGVAVFRTEREIPGTTLAEDSYRGYPVMTIEPNWIESPTIDYTRKLFEYDPGTGRAFTLDRAEASAPVHGYRWTALERADVDTMRRWLYSRRGRARGLWLPTWTDDLKLATLLTAGTTALEIEFVGLVEFGVPQVHRRDLRIQLVSGAVYYRRVVSTADIDDAREQLVIDSGISIDVAPADVERISWMHFARLDSDTIDISFAHAGNAELVVRMRGPNNDF